MFGYAQAALYKRTDVQETNALTRASHDLSLNIVEER
jgi:hypothetical protein